MSPPELEDIECPRCGHEALGADQMSVGSKASLLGFRLLDAAMRRLLRLRYWCRTCKRYVPVQREVPRSIIGYHGCDRRFAQELIAGRVDAAAWLASEKDYDWLGHGVYFWEHAPGRAWQWAVERHPGAEAVVAVEIRLGRCLDLGDTRAPLLLRAVYEEAKEAMELDGKELPSNVGGPDKKARKLDCFILNRLMKSVDRGEVKMYQTIRCPFEEGEPAYPGSNIRVQSHVQIAVRDPRCLSRKVYLIEKGAMQ